MIAINVYYNYKIQIKKVEITKRFEETKTKIKYPTVSWLNERTTVLKAQENKEQHKHHQIPFVKLVSVPVLSLMQDPVSFYEQGPLFKV